MPARPRIATKEAFFPCSLPRDHKKYGDEEEEHGHGVGAVGCAGGLRERSGDQGRYGDEDDDLAGVPGWRGVGLPEPAKGVPGDEDDGEVGQGLNHRGENADDRSLCELSHEPVMDGGHREEKGYFDRDDVPRIFLPEAVYEVADEHDEGDAEDFALAADAEAGEGVDQGDERAAQDVAAAALGGGRFEDGVGEVVAEGVAGEADDEEPCEARGGKEDGESCELLLVCEEEDGHCCGHEEEAAIGDAVGDGAG